MEKVVKSVNVLLIVHSHTDSEKTEAVYIER